MRFQNRRGFEVVNHIVEKIDLSSGTEIYTVENVSAGTTVGES